jgi:hypothetical protein
MFFNACGLWIIFKNLVEIDNVDIFKSNFLQEFETELLSDKEQQVSNYLRNTLSRDTSIFKSFFISLSEKLAPELQGFFDVFVHGKVYNRNFLLKNNLR